MSVATRAVVAPGPDLDCVRELFQEYAQSLGIDLSFQGFDAELAGLPGDYGPPAGALILCLCGGQPAGCVAVHAWQARACEMKRLFVRAAYQGRGLGRLLARRAIEWARESGYERMLLDTLPTMAPAQQLYERLGFREAEAYRFNPIAGTRYMELPLVPGATRTT